MELYKQLYGGLTKKKTFFDKMEKIFLFYKLLYAQYLLVSVIKIVGGNLNLLP